jgi:hypothetical protein
MRGPTSRALFPNLCDCLGRLPATCRFGGTIITAATVTENVGNPHSFSSKVYVTAYFVVWAVFFVLLRKIHGFETSEAVSALAMLGLILPGISLLATRRVPTLPYVVLRPVLEPAILFAYLAVVTVVLVLGFPGLAGITTEPLHSFAVLGLKIATFVVVPGAMRLASGYKIKELAPVSLATVGSS